MHRREAGTDGCKKEMWRPVSSWQIDAKARLSWPLLAWTTNFRCGWFDLELCRLLDEFLADVVAKRSPRLMLFAPPQHGKSELVSRRFPAYVLGKYPELRVIATGYGASLAYDLSTDVQTIMDGDLSPVVS